MSKHIKFLWAGLIVGFIYGLWLMAAIVVYSPEDRFIDTKKAIDQCEAGLPRNQHCVAYVVVEVSDE